MDINAENFLYLSVCFISFHLLVIGCLEIVRMAANIDMITVMDPNGISGSINTGEFSNTFSLCAGCCISLNLLGEI